MNFLNGMFKPKEQVMQHISNTQIIQSQAQNIVPQQSSSNQQPQPGKQQSLFKGSMKIKQPQIQEAQQPSPAKVNSEILQPESDAYKQQINSQKVDPETPTLIDEPEPKQQNQETKKKSGGFGFIKKKQADPHQQQIEEQVQVQVESQIIYGMERDTLEIIEPNNIAHADSQIHQTQLQSQDEPLKSLENDAKSVKTNEQQFTYKSSTPTRINLDNSYQRQHVAILEELNLFLKETNQKKAEIFAKQQEIERSVGSFQKNLKDYHKQQVQLSIEQQVWIQQDQFEKAEEIEQQLKQIQDKITQIEKQIKLQEYKYQQLQDEKENIRGEEYPFYQEIEQKLDEIEILQKKYSEAYKTEGQTYLKRLQQQIEEENERVKIQQIHTEIDEKHLIEEELHLNQIMDNQTKEYRNEQEILQGKKVALENEIQELLQLLAQKQNDLSKVQENLSETKEKIQQVRQKFTQQLEKVLNKRTKLHDEHNSLAQERAQIEQLENDFLRKQTNYKNQIEYLKEQLIQIQIQRQDLLKRANQIPEQCQMEGDAVHKYNEAKNETLIQYQDLAKVQRQIDELNYLRNLSQTQLNEILSKKSELSSKLPKMIDDKAILVQNKNFKGAASINEQIKEAQKQISQYEDKISENQRNETELLKQIEKIENELIQKQSNYENSFVAFEISRFFVLEIKLAEIQQLQEVDMSPLILEVIGNLQQIQEELTRLGLKYNQQISLIKQGTSTQINVAESQLDQQQLTDEMCLIKQSSEDLSQENQKPDEQDSPTPIIEETQKGVQEENFNNILPEFQGLSSEDLEQLIRDHELQKHEVSKQIQEMEQLIQNYAENEQYEEADDLQTKCSLLQAELTQINCTLEQLQIRQQSK